jgi:transposase-like protein
MSNGKGTKATFACRHFDREIILLCVRWYLRYKLRLRDRVEMMAERGRAPIRITVDGCAASHRAAIIIARVELLSRIHKSQFALSHLRLRDQAVPAIRNAVLSA